MAAFNSASRLRSSALALGPRVRIGQFYAQRSLTGHATASVFVLQDRRVVHDAVDDRGGRRRVEEGPRTSARTADFTHTGRQAWRIGVR